MVVIIKNLFFLTFLLSGMHFQKMYNAKIYLTIKNIQIKSWNPQNINTTVRSVIDYALPVYCKTLKQTELSRLEKLQYRAAKIVTGAFQFTSREKLNIELGWETIEKRADILGLNMFQKIHLHETRPMIRKCMPKLDIDRQHKIRSRGG